MTRDEIIGAMRSVCDKDKVDAWQNDFWAITQQELERFAALVAASEREACAKVCEAAIPAIRAFGPELAKHAGINVCNNLAGRIRAR
jgi:hypothetical protein